MKRWFRPSSRRCAGKKSPRQVLEKTALHKRRAVESLEWRILLSATPTSITVSASATSAVYGQAVNLTADVTASPSPPSEGNVTFFDNGASLGTAGVTSGAAALDNLHLPAGTNSITASYSDTSGNFASSSAAAVGPNATINTIAGGLGSGLPATAASIGYATNIAVDSSGNLFIPDLFGNVVREVQSGTGNLVTAAGNGLGGFSGDGGVATAATIYNPQGVAVDSAGDLFIADYGNHVVREVDHATGVITTVAGNGTAGYSGDGGAATAAELSSPVDVAVFGGNLFISDLANVIREVNLTTGVISTAAGNGTRGYSGDGGAATAAELAAPQGIAFDSAGDLFIADSFNYRVREVDHATGNITTVAGNGSFGFASGDGGAATAATIGEPYAVAVDPSSGDLFIADTISNKVRKVVNPTGAGVISTVAGTGFSGYSGDGGPGTAAELNYPDGLAVDASGDLYIAEQNGYRVRKVVLATDTITTAAGNGDTFFGGDGHPATEAQFTAIGIAVDPSGNVAIADGGNNRVREVNHATGIMSTVAGNGTRGFNGDGGAATAAELISPQAVAFDSSGNLFIAEGNDIREVNQATGKIATVAGNGSPGFTGDGGAATAAELRDPEGIAVDSSGDLFIADTFNQRVREVDHATGVITTVAGDGTGGFSGDGGQATAAELAGPTGVAVDSTNHLLFIADEGNDRIREVNLATGVITTVAGNGTAGFSGDGGAATAAELNVPQGIALDGSGDLFIGDTENRRVREVDLATGTITTVAGNGTLGVSGDGGPASSAELILYPNGVAVDSSGDLLIGDDIRLRELANGAVVVNVTPAPLTITADDKSKVYGAAVPTLTASYSGFVNGDTAASLTMQPTLSTTATAGSHVSGSPYPITVGGASDPNYTISYVQGSLNVTPATLTITADDKSKAYGAPLPTLTVSYSGFVNGDTAASLTSPPTLSTTATAGSHVSGNPYPITAGGAADSDYTISYVTGSLTVTPVVLTITADNKSKAYGAPLPTLTASYSGFVNGDTAASLTTPPMLSTTATAGSQVSGSPYPITASGAVDSDYTISYVAGSLTVTPVALTITADNKSKAYGAPLPTLTASYAGFVNGDTAASLTMQPTDSTTATAASHVSGSPYPITVGGASDLNYTITYVPGSLTVTPVALTITADDKSKAYGAPLPTFTASYTGFVNGDTAASLTTPPTLSTTATADSHVSGSPYTITASGAVDSDYTISYVPGSLTVTPVALTITADDKNKAYGAPLPTLTASYAGFVNGDSNASLTTQPTLSTTATASSHVSGSPYPITASGAVDSDYTVSYVPGSLTVTPVLLTITADNKNKAYGAPLPTLTASYSGFVNGDSAASLTTQPTLSTTATASSHVSGSPYPITASGAVDSDYTVSYVPGSLTVTPVLLTITADDKTKVVGAPLPTLTASSAGFVNGDIAASLTTQPALSTTATASSPPGAYPITAQGAADPDYAISYDAGTLKVVPASQPGSLQFSAATYNASETGGTAAITVTRIGGTSGAVSVTVSTSDGSAKAGTDYTTTTKTLTWADGDTSPKTITIPILDDNGTAETTQTVNLNLTGATGGPTLGSQKTATLNIAEDNDQPLSGVLFLEGQPGDGSDATFVQNLYRNLLGREPEASGTTFWVGLIEGGGNQSASTQFRRDRAVADILNSPEYKEHLVFLMYETLLDRAPDLGGLAFWTDKLGEPGTPGGATGSSDEKFVLAAIAGSQEYYVLHGGTNAGWISALYKDLLGRAPDADGLAGWEQQAAQQPGDRDGIVRDILDSPEAEHKLLNAFYPAADPSIPPPGSPAGGPYALADITGGGWENLYFQGDFSSLAANDLFFDELAAQMPWDAVNEQMVESSQYYDAARRGL